MKKEKPQFEYFIGGLLRVISNEVSGSFMKRMAEFAITPGEWMVLRTLYETDRNKPSDVAAFIGFTRGAISKQVEKLVRKDLIERRENKSDRRFQTIKLTPKALEIVPLLLRSAAENDEQYFSFLSKSKREEFRKTLEIIAKHHKMEGLPIK